MRGITLLIVCFLVGCVPAPTLEELETQASRSGDWSEVEKRERILAKREARRGLNCQAGYVSYCESYGGMDQCTCVKHDVLVDVFATWR